jgi:hypothetical protein
MGQQSKAKNKRRTVRPGTAPQYVLTDEAPTSASAWKNKSKTQHSLRLPSGNVALVRRVGPEAFLEQDLMPDNLAPIVQKAIHSKRGLPPKALESAIAGPEGLGKMVEMMDRVTVYAVIEPHVEMPPGCITCGGLDNTDNRAVHDDPEADGHHKFEEGPRDETILYVDEVDMMDKMFIMNYCVGGSSDLERFRVEHRAAVGSLDLESGMEGAPV